jgi:hypothetical protein
MNTFVRFFYEFISIFFEGIGTVVTGIYSGFLEMFNIREYSTLINNYKTVTSRLIRKEFQDFLKPYYSKPFFWSDSYFICTVSDRTEEMIRHDLQNRQMRRIPDEPCGAEGTLAASGICRN